MTKSQTVELLKKQLPGFYSVEQVIEMINKIEDGGSLDEEKLQILIDKITTKVENQLDRMCSEDFVDFDSAEFELNGNEISVTSVDVNTSTVVDEISDAISDAVHDFFPAPQEA